MKGGDMESARELLIMALDTLGLALVHHNHQWTNKERELYEKAMAALLGFYSEG